MNDYNALANAFLAAIKQSADAQVGANNTAQLNTNASINNQANARGTLYSTQPSFMQSVEQNKTNQKNASIQTNVLSNTFNVQSSLLDTKYKIDAMNRAAAELNKMTFEY